MKYALLAVLVAFLVVLATAPAGAVPTEVKQDPVVENPRDAPTVSTTGQNMTRDSTDPDWLEGPRRFRPLSEYEITPDIQDRWHVFADWFMLFMYLFKDGMGF